MRSKIDHQPDTFLPVLEYRLFVFFAISGLAFWCMIIGCGVAGIGWLLCGK